MPTPYSFQGNSTWSRHASAMTCLSTRGCGIPSMTTAYSTCRSRSSFGTISVGTFGSAVRATYTGIGLQTNIAARIQAEAKPGGILLSNTSWHLIKDTVDCEPRGEVLVKGVHFPIELYEPIQ